MQNYNMSGKIIEESLDEFWYGDDFLDTSQNHNYERDIPDKLAITKIYKKGENDLPYKRQC